MIRLREEREKKGYTLQQLADLLGIAPNTLHNYETKKRHPNVEMLVKMCDLFNCSIDYLVGQTDIKSRADAAEATCNNNAEICITPEYLSELTPSKVKEILSLIESVGFDLQKIINDKRT